MVFGWMLATGTDTKGRRLLHNKKENIYYRLPKNREIFVTLWKYNAINAISISVILGYFLVKNITITIFMAILVYIVVFLLMNFRFLPTLHKVNAKKVTWRKEEVQKETTSIIPAILFFLIGIGLFLCLYMGETHGDLESATAIGGGVLAIAMGLQQLYNMKNKKVR